MAATISTTCERCGTVDVPVPATRLSLSLSETESRNVLHFACPSCGTDQLHHVTERGTRLLTGAGITVAVEVESEAAVESPRFAD